MVRAAKRQRAFIKIGLQSCFAKVTLTALMADTILTRGTDRFEAIFYYG